MNKIEAKSGSGEREKLLNAHISKFLAVFILKMNSEE